MREKERNVLEKISPVFVQISLLLELIKMDGYNSSSIDRDNNNNTRKLNACNSKKHTHTHKH